MDCYGARQAQMERWYEALLRDEDAAERAFIADYGPHAGSLARLQGRVIDIGGGAGLAARYLDRFIDYVVVDPSPIWTEPSWLTFSDHFRCDGPEPVFITAPGEGLPFPEAWFDAAISCWALNHVQDPAKCIGEMLRVLSPGGRAYLVLEDMPPSWVELASDAARRIGARLFGRRHQAEVRVPLALAFTDKLAGTWPLAPDHMRIAESSLLSWTSGTMKLRRRSWTGGYRTYEFVKCGRA